MHNIYNELCNCILHTEQHIFVYYPLPLRSLCLEKCILNYWLSRISYVVVTNAFWSYTGTGFGSAMRPCATRTCLFRLSYTQYGRCAPPPTIAALLLYSLYILYYSTYTVFLLARSVINRENLPKIPVWVKILELVSQRPTESTGLSYSDCAACSFTCITPYMSTSHWAPIHPPPSHASRIIL